jgi:hypothetical protein
MLAILISLVQNKAHHIYIFPATEPRRENSDTGYQVGQVGTYCTRNSLSLSFSILSLSSVLCVNCLKYSKYKVNKVIKSYFDKKNVNVI